MVKDFAEQLDDLIDAVLEAGAETHEDIISALELKLMALKEESLGNQET